MTRAVVAEFYKTAGGRFELFNMVVEDGDYRKTYDVDLSRAYGYVFHHSGSGGGELVGVQGIYHVSGDIEVRENPTDRVDARDKPPWRSRRTRAIRKRNRTRRLRRLPKAFDPGRGLDLLDWLQRHAIEADTVWCSVCRDRFPEDSVCKHVWWCDDKEWWSTPDDRCSHKTLHHCLKQPRAWRARESFDGHAGFPSVARVDAPGPVRSRSTGPAGVTTK